MREFVDKKLVPVLDANEIQKLAEVSGKWPAYPLTIQEFSRKRGLQPPWHYLPEPDRWKWELYRAPRATSWDVEAKEDAPRPAPGNHNEK
jgi:hypothetical protein